jgi:hypothetical protein
VKQSDFKKDKYYSNVVAAVNQLLKVDSVVKPVELLIQMGYLKKEDYENWRFGRVSYLERMIQCNLSKINRILHLLRWHAEERGLRPSHTAYVKWGKGAKVQLRFSKSGNPVLESAYSTHYVAGAERQAVKQVGNSL